MSTFVNLVFSRFLSCLRGIVKHNNILNRATVTLRVSFGNVAQGTLLYYTISIRVYTRVLLRNRHTYLIVGPAPCSRENSLIRCGMNARFPFVGCRYPTCAVRCYGVYVLLNLTLGMLRSWFA